MISEIQNKDSQVGQYFVECSGSANDIEWKFLDTCRRVEKLMTVDAIQISKLEPGPNTRSIQGAETHAKIIVEIIILTWEGNTGQKMFRA